MGRNLIELGMKPGIQFKEILSKALELQLDGEISTLDNAIEWAKVEIQKYGE
jgi:tRNA nucleotidyltransferase/poly(A) polymerase